MSTLKVTNIQATGETASRSAEGVIAAYVHYDQVGTFEVRDSLNQSSTTDNGTGKATLNFTNNMADGYYGFLATMGNGSTGSGISLCGPRTNDPSSSALRIEGTNYANTNADRSFNCITAFGEMA
jgi:hypothetical protein